MKTINCYNLYHLGDCIQALHFLINAAKYNNIKFNFFCNKNYHTQLQEFIKNENINLITEPDPTQVWIDTWIGAYDYGKICEISDKIFNKDSDQGTFFFIVITNIIRKNGH